MVAGNAARVRAEKQSIADANNFVDPFKDAT